MITVLQVKNSILEFENAIPCKFRNKLTPYSGETDPPFRLIDPPLRADICMSFRSRTYGIDPL
jgi:hypothetical protein